MAQTPNSQIDNLIEALSGESDQELAAAQDSGSYLVEASALNLVRREKEYSDPEKQWVRGRWLRFAEELHERLERPLRYLTLPAYHRLDVMMMMQKNLLRIRREAGREILYVAAFETDPGKFSRMTGATPEFKLFGNCALEEALVDASNLYHADLLRMFPFDIVNFDLTSSLTPKHEGPYSRVMQALDEVFKRQALRHDEWGLFLTFRNVEAEWEPTALAQFISNLQFNLDSWPLVREKFIEKLHVPTAQRLLVTAPTTAIVQSVAKWLVDRAHVNGHTCEHIESYHYKRPVAGHESYTISKLLMRFRRGTQTQSVVPTKTVVRETWMEADLVRCIANNRHTDVEDVLLKSDKDLIDNLTDQVTRLVADFEKTFTRANAPSAGLGSGPGE